MVVGRAAEGRYDLVVVGGGIAGFSACETAVESGARVCLVSGEDRIPYKRTRISKHVAVGFGRDDFAIKPREWYGDHGITLLVDESITSLGTGGRAAETSGGRGVRWDSLVLATGGVVRTIPTWGAVERFHVVHTAADAERLRRSVAPEATVLVVGGGVLGVEVAEQLSLAGARATLSAMGERLMVKELDRRASEVLEAEARGAGIEVVCGDETSGPLGVSERGVEYLVAGVPRLFDLVVACIGVVPDTRVAVEAGIATNRGVLVDRRLETSQAGVFAAGDLAEHEDGTVTHLWHAAEEQGRIAGRTALGGEAPSGLLTHRLKCEVFGRYFFSVGARGAGQTDEVVEEERSGAYRRLLYRSGRLSGVVMIDDRDRAKLYERAVREGWSPLTVREELPLRYSQDTNG